MKMVTATWPQLMLASVTMCNDDIRNYNSKISDLGYLTPSSKGWCLCRARDGVYRWLGVSYIWILVLKRLKISNLNRSSQVNQKWTNGYQTLKLYRRNNSESDLRAPDMIFRTWKNGLFEVWSNLKNAMMTVASDQHAQTCSAYTDSQ